MENKMAHMGNIKIISFNHESNQVCASAARISTTKGNAFDIFYREKNIAENNELIKKVLSSGHKSLIEHAVFTIAFCNVSAFVEQFMIEFRLASFTIKSRRYVDFGKSGYVVPKALCGNDLDVYKQYMDILFDAYSLLIEKKAPKEDARFLLPYSFHSNFYCTINGRELVHIIRTIKYGRGKPFPELQDMAQQLISQLDSIFPALVLEIESNAGDIDSPEYYNFGDTAVHTPKFIDENNIGGVALYDYPQNPGRNLEIAYQANTRSPSEANAEDIVNQILFLDRPRELEQLSYSFLISNITLSGITHIVRHRMQSIIIPPIYTTNMSEYILPKTISSNYQLANIYTDAINKSNEVLQNINGDSPLHAYRYYFVLSGNMLNIATTMNARELMLYIKLRSCRRAQWEIQNVTVNMLQALRGHFPQLFNKMGPSCFIDGYSPQAKLSCSNMQDVVEAFQQV